MPNGLELGPLRSFLELARLGNMTRVAEALHLTQPAVSNQLARLEGELGQALFDRTPAGMVLTRAGETFRSYAEDVFGSLEAGREAIDELAGLERGALAIGGGATATTYLFPPLLGRFHERYPSIRLFVREQGSQSVVEAVESGDLDLGVVTLPLPAGHAPRLSVESWVDDDLRLIVPGDHPLRRRKRFRWKELDGEALVLFEAGSAVRALIDRHLAQARIRVQPVMELRSIESIKQMVAQGIGAAFVSRFALASSAHSLVCSEGPLRRELAIVTRRGRTSSAATRAFLELLRLRRPGGARAQPPRRSAGTRRS
jgi:LysR family cyn operon transcriptional activator